MDSVHKQPAKTRFGVIGLGTGSIAAYASPGQSWTFFEINPAIERIARDPEYFSYLSQCAPQARVVIGDARLSLEHEPDASFDVLFVDAFSSDSIPVHLMTREAMALYFRKLAPGGVLALHISNRYLELTPVVARVAYASGLVAAAQVHQPSDEQLKVSSEITTSHWTILARSPDDFGELAADPRWRPLDGTVGAAWTDDYSNIISTIRW
jgi:spermidine synthase